MPSIVIVPEVGVSSPTMQRPSVVLPEPDSPTSPTLSPSPTSIETPASASTLPLARDERLAQVGDVDERRARAGDGLDVSALRGLQALAPRISARILSMRTQAVARASASERSGVGPARHSSAVQLQRALNGQRPATSSGAGTAPSIECRWARRRSPGGSDSSSPSVYGCSGSSSTAAAGATSSSEPAYST